MSRVGLNRRLPKLWALVSRRRQRRRYRGPVLDENADRSPVQDDLLARYAPDRSFADIGCLWRIDGSTSFRAEELGATSVTAVDVDPETDRFRARREQGASSVRFVQGDIHDADVAAEIGLHDVVWCTGVLYHTPSPALLVDRLLSISRELVILGNKTIPDIPGVPQGAVFFPGMTDREREPFALVFGGVAAPFRPHWQFANWWWGLTNAATRALVECHKEWEVVETATLPWVGAFDNYVLVARRVE